jgi:hypothetical protein
MSGDIREEGGGDSLTVIASMADSGGGGAGGKGEEEGGRAGACLFLNPSWRASGHSIPAPPAGCLRGG